MILHIKGVAIEYSYKINTYHLTYLHIYTYLLILWQLFQYLKDNL